MSEETEIQTEQLETWSSWQIRPTVFFPAAVLIVLFVLLGVIFSDQIPDAFGAAQDFVNTTLGWFYILAASIFLVFVIFIAAGPWGRIRLGPDDAKPEYTYWGWFAMMFSTGMGIGLLFFSVAEPISHFGIDVPPATDAEPGTLGAAREAMNVTFFHWGLHAWAIYGVVGLAICYFAYRKGLPLALRSAFYPIIGDRIRGRLGDGVDTLAIVGTLFGVATSLGLGVVQINAGLDYTAGIEPSRLIQLALIVVITAAATISVVLGLDRGIKRLSEGNLIFAGALVLFILAVGPTIYILQGLIETTGYYLQNIVATSMRTDMFTDESWQGEWTLFYWGWWISWSPFVGMFIARVSRGRTVREFIAGVLLVPTLLTFIFLTVFGQTALHMELFGEGGIVEATEESLEFALFAMLEQLPLATITSVVAILAIAGFFVTSSDSGSMVDDIHASGGNPSPAWQTRVFWSLAEGSVAAVLLLAGGESGVEAFQQASIMTGVPVAILLLVMCWAIYTALRDDLAESRASEESADQSRQTLPSAQPGLPPMKKARDSD